MLKKVDKVFIGKYIERTGALVDNATITTVQSNAVEGEIVILDSEYKVMVGASATYANSKVIYIAEGSAEVFTTANPNGTVLTGRRLLISGSIDGARIVNYKGGKYVAKSEAVATFPAIDGTIIAGTEYVLRVVFKGDIAAQHPGQNIETHRYTAKTGDTSTMVYDGLVARINKRYTNSTITKGRNKVITATNAAGVLTITALPVWSSTSDVNSIDGLVMNDFAAYLNYVDNDYNWEEVPLTSAKTYVGSDRGYGTWESIRDAEKNAMAYEGVSNYTWFPVIKPAMRTVKGANYNLITIENDRVYRSADNQYNKETSLVQLIALQTGTGATAAQGTEVLATLNTWMASTPRAWAAVSFA